MMMFLMLRGKHLSIVKHSKRKKLLLLALLLMVVVSPLHAGQWQGRSMGSHIILAEMDGSSAARLVERKTGGKVLSVHRQEKKGRVQYRVKVLLPEGRVRTVSVDAETGQMGG